MSGDNFDQYPQWCQHIIDSVCIPAKYLLAEFTFKDYLQILFYINIDKTENTPYFSSNAGCHIEFPGTRKSVKSNNHQFINNDEFLEKTTLQMKQQLNKYRIQNKSSAILASILKFSLNDDSPASFKMFITNMSSNKNQHKKTLFSNAGLYFSGPQGSWIYVVHK